MEIEQQVPNITRAQKRGYDGKFRFDIDIPQNEAFGTITLTTDGSTRAYDVPTGNRFRVRTLIIYNGEADDNEYMLRDTSAGSLVLHAFCPAKQQIVQDYKGPFFSGDVYVSATTYSTAGYLSIGGILDAKE